MAPEFLFINKDAGSSSLTRSNASEQTSINSHVQRGRPHVRAARTAGRLANRTQRTHPRDHPNKNAAPSGSSPSGRRTTPSNSPEAIAPTKDPSSQRGVASQAILPSRPQSQDKPSPPAKTLKARPNPKPPRRSESSYLDPTHNSPVTHKKSVVLLNPSNYVGSPRDISQVTSTSLDPFAQSVVKLDPHVARLCRYFCDNFQPSVWSAESRIREKSYVYQSSATAVMRRAMQSEVEMNAILACMAARIENVDLLPGQGTDKFMGNALKAVRRRFGSASKHQLLLIIFHLFAAEAYRQNYQAARIHMRAAKTMFASWGGLDHVPDPFIRDLFIIGDANMSAAVLESCELPCEYDPGWYWSTTAPVLQLAPEQDLSKIAPALREILFHGLLPSDLAEAIQESAECVWVLRHAPKGLPDAVKHATRWLYWRNLSIRHRLLALKYSDPGLDAIRVALIMWILTAMVLLGLKRLGNLIAPKLHLLLQDADRTLDQWDGLFEVRIWIFTIGAMCSLIGGEEEKWFVEQLFDAGFLDNIRRLQKMYPTIEIVDVLTGLQERFFYYEPIQRPRLERLAQLISGTQDSESVASSQDIPSDAGAKSQSPS